MCCALVDASKAYDKVLYNGLFKKLMDMKVPNIFVSGVRQAYLFAVYIDELVVNLKRSGFRAYIGQLLSGCFLYADDIALLSATLSANNGRHLC